MAAETTLWGYYQVKKVRDGANARLDQLTNRIELQERLQNGLGEYGSKAANMLSGQIINAGMIVYGFADRHYAQFRRDRWQEIREGLLSVCNQFPFNLSKMIAMIISQSVAQESELNWDSIKSEIKKHYQEHSTDMDKIYKLLEIIGDHPFLREAQKLRRTIDAQGNIIDSTEAWKGYFFSLALVGVKNRIIDLQEEIKEKEEKEKTLPEAEQEDYYKEQIVPLKKKTEELQKLISDLKKLREYWEKSK